MEVDGYSTSSLTICSNAFSKIGSSYIKVLYNMHSMIPYTTGAVDGFIIHTDSSGGWDLCLCYSMDIFNNGVPSNKSFTETVTAANNETIYIDIECYTNGYIRCYDSIEDIYIKSSNTSNFNIQSITLEYRYIDTKI